MRTHSLAGTGNRRCVVLTIWLLITGITGSADARPPQVTPEPQGQSGQSQTSTAGSNGDKSQQNQQMPTTAAEAGMVRIGEPGNVVRLSGGSARVVLSMSGLGATVDKLSGAQVADLAATLQFDQAVRVGERAAPAVRITRDQFLGRPGAGSLAWLVTVGSDGLPPGSTERRVASLWFGADAARERYAVEFTLTNLPPTTAQYDVTVPGHDWFVSRSDTDVNRTYPLLIVNKSEPIVGLRLAQASLKRGDDGSIGFSEIALVPDANGRPAPVDLSPNETKTVFLRLDKSERLLPYGSFSGQVQLISNGTTPKAIPVTARVTSAGVRLAGAILVLLGLVTSLFITNRLQPRLARLQALRPATLLRDRLLAFADDSTKRAGADVAGIVAEANTQAARLETRALDADGLIPPEISAAGGVTGGAAAQVQTLLTEISERLAGLLVLRDAAAQLSRMHPEPGRDQHVQAAIDALNAAASSTTSAANAQTAVTSILDVLRNAAGPQREFAVVPSQITTQRLDFLLHQTANVAAFIWAAVSLAIGVTYVYSDADFGTAVDLLGMFLWGLGLTTFGAGIQQLTPRQVATQIGVVVPRSAADPVRA
jgi:hypothetical protein